VVLPAHAQPPATASPPAVTLVQTQSWAEFTNANGRWTIFLRCLGPRAHRRYPVTVGPGYIARVVRTSDDVLVTNDERRVGGGNAPGNGGLGEFSWHGARRNGRYFDYNHAWSVDGRTCSFDGWALGHLFRPIVGVYATRVWEPPQVVDGEGRLGIDVYLRDTKGPLLRVRYEYRVLTDVVKANVSVTELTQLAYVKEPKLLAAVQAGGYTRMAVFDADGKVARNSLETNRDSGWKSFECLWMGVNAYLHSGQCDDPGRERVRFDFGDYWTGTDGRCAGKCLNVVMRAARRDGTPVPWEGSGYGLDGWAVASASRTPYAPTDSRLDGVKWSCKGRSPGARIVRRWELVGYTRTSLGSYSNATAMFHGWEGGRGFGDCEPQSRRFGPRGETWSVAAEYWFGD
jgi:hypothetical protein